MNWQKRCSREEMAFAVEHSDFKRNATAMQSPRRRVPGCFRDRSRDIEAFHASEFQNFSGAPRGFNARDKSIACTCFHATRREPGPPAKSPISIRAISGNPCKALTAASEVEPVEPAT